MFVFVQSLSGLDTTTIIRITITATQIAFTGCCLTTVEPIFVLHQAVFVVVVVPLATISSFFLFFF